ncbi:hexameric tyrosine-coordinated heme protein [Virgibacillus sp. W0430]|uniref:hexameric tyrosine-coordinated heme protein n=1 Tax=Virgibacillus sp. W0430 TaxID=3391580 RepID=UPI003F4663FB
MEKWIKSLKTATPQEGYELAIKLAQKGIAYTQPSERVRKKLRPKYSRNADNLIAASQVIAIHYQTVAAANNYWRVSTRNSRP